MPLYEVAVLDQPTKREREDGAEEKLVFGPAPMIATDPQSAAIDVVVQNEVVRNLDRTRMQVLVRPFV